MKITLIGPRSVGKSTVGRYLAKKINIKYFDFDEHVEKSLNGIDNHVKINGAKSYRINERKILKKFISELPEKYVISVGGGTIASQFEEINKRNTQLLKSSGKIIYLSPCEDKDMAVKILFEREQKRKGNKTYSETLKLYKSRKNLYEKVFDIKIETGKKSPSEIVKEILKIISP